MQVRGQGRSRVFRCAGQSSHAALGASSVDGDAAVKSVSFISFSAPNGITALTAAPSGRLPPRIRSGVERLYPDLELFDPACAAGGAQAPDTRAALLRQIRMAVDYHAAIVRAASACCTGQRSHRSRRAICRGPTLEERRAAAEFLAALKGCLDQREISAARSTRSDDGGAGARA